MRGLQPTPYSTCANCWIIYSLLLSCIERQQIRHPHVTTSVKSHLAKGRIADLSPFTAANGFVWSWPHLTHDSLDPHESNPQTTSRSVQPFLYRSPVYPTHRQAHTCDICCNRSHQCYASDATKKLHTVTSAHSPGGAV